MMDMSIFMSLLTLRKRLDLNNHALAIFPTINSPFQFSTLQSQAKAMIRNLGM